MWPLRSMLFIPAHKLDWVRGVGRFKPDSVVLDLEDADPDACVHVACVHHRNLELQALVGRVAGRAPRIEGAPGCAPDVAAGGKLLRELGRQDAGADGAVLQRRGVFVELDQLRKALAHFCDQCEQQACAFVREIAPNSARDDAVHHETVAEAGVRVELALAGRELATTRKRLASLWGNPGPRFERAEGSLDILPSLPALDDLNSRLATSPSLLRARIEVDHRLALAEVERSQRIPNLTVSLGAKRREELGRNQTILGVSIPLPIFNRNQGNLLEALRRIDKARDELSTAEVRLFNELAQAHERLSTAHQEVALLQRDILPGAQSAFDAATRGFELGKFSFLEVLDAQRTLFQAKSQYLHALSEAHQSAAEIERILGEALPDLTLAPAAAKP